MKTLIVAAHPSIETSTVNKRWVEELKKYPEKYTVHELYRAYPAEKIDVEKERGLIESHENLVLQFPIQWFNSPSLLKKWMDEVFDYGCSLRFQWRRQIKKPESGAGGFSRYPIQRL